LLLKQIVLISSMYNINKIGPKTDPCGTPLRTGTHSEKQCSVTTHCKRFDKKKK
jgi:hypothetical protein